ncbi:aminotransferase class I/II-fold pyridoxal phosphate-dependent enzyme, partial [Streptomyces sp. A1136]
MNLGVHVQDEPAHVQRNRALLRSILPAEPAWLTQVHGINVADAALVQGAGTGAIRAGLAALLKPGQRLLVHDAPVYPTTRVIIEQMGLTLITVDFNDLSALKQVVDEQQPDAALVQHTRQQPQDSYVLADVLATLRAAGVPALTDDNYAVMKVARIGCECGANVSTFSCFKLFGPEGVGAVVGDADVINRIR